MHKAKRLFKRFLIAAAFLGIVFVLADGVDDDAEAPTLRLMVSLSKGTLVICGGGEISDEVLDEFVAAAGGTDGRIVVITSASELADTDEIEDELEYWRSQKLASLTILHTRSRETANDPNFTGPLATATGVWFGGGDQGTLADIYVSTLAERMIHDVMSRGGVVGGISAGAAVMSSVMIRSGDEAAKTGRGFGFLPGTVIDQHFLARNRQERLLNALANNPGHVGIGIDERAAVLVRGGKMSVLGESDVVACISSSRGNPPRLATLRPGEEADLLKWSQDANRTRKRKPAIRLASGDSAGD